MLSLVLASSTGCVVVDPSCSGGGASIVISPPIVVVSVGQSQTPKAQWCRGGRYDDLSPNWRLASTADATVISLDPVTGRITGKRAGTATVIATYTGASGSSVQVTVR
jgi:hypothetical protein